MKTYTNQTFFINLQKFFKHECNAAFENISFNGKRLNRQHTVMLKHLYWQIFI